MKEFTFVTYCTFGKGDFGETRIGVELTDVILREQKMTDEIWLVEENIYESIIFQQCI